MISCVAVNTACVSEGKSSKAEYNDAELTDHSFVLLLIAGYPVVYSQTYSSIVLLKHALHSIS